MECDLKSNLLGALLLSEGVRVVDIDFASIVLNKTIRKYLL
jgi:hypothetical protein